MCTILAVDDNPEVLTMVRLLLEHAGHEVLVANSPAEALRIHREFKRPIDLLLSDVVMPEVYGPDLAAVIAKDRPQLKVLLMSGQLPDQFSPTRDGWNFLPKPFRTEEFFRAVAHALN